MSIGLITGLLLIGLILLILLEVPIGFALISVGLAGYAWIDDWQPAFGMLGTLTSTTLESVDLATLPLFLLMGAFATVAGFSSDVYEAIAAIFGHRKGGLAYATVGASAGFGVVCGSSTATAATFARSALPEMLNRGYSARFAAGAVAAGGTIKSLIPPSVLMILYCVATNTYIFDVFVGAVIPAFITVLANLLVIGILARVYPYDAPTLPRKLWAERVPALKRAIPALLLIAIVFGGLYSGIFTVNEAASVAAILSFFAAILRRRLTIENFARNLKEAASTTAMLYMILIGAFLFGQFVEVAGIPHLIGSYIKSLEVEPVVVIFVMLIIFLLMGAIFEEISAVLMLIPITVPIILQLGYDPIWWAIINVAIIEVGMIAPPIGIIVFLIHGIHRDISLGAIYKGVAPYLVCDILVLVGLVLFPGLVTWLPHLVNN